MILSHHINALRKIVTHLAGSEVNWVVTGSLAFALQGLNTEVSDIDIQTDEAGAYEIERRFSRFVVREVSLSSGEGIRSHFGEILMDGVKVEIMGDLQKRLADGRWDAPVDLAQHKRTVEVEGMQIPILTLEYEYQAYLKLGRTEKAAIIRELLSKTTDTDAMSSSR